ncbi:hypothetical protein BDW59DRAFT_53324 [Aspergillus cavernicola]|uniref:FAD-binding domain-containing protein n=1 Tax=Aspergillus cavernicola TaxID=176166 RepID=A0ABR4IJM1_9EURO
MGSTWSSLQTKSTNRISHLLSSSKTTPPSTNGASPAPAATDAPAINSQPQPPLRETCDIAIIGGGIIGIIVALGLLHRNINVTVYERAQKFTETSAGFSFSAGAREAMRSVSPKVLEAFARVAAPNEYPFIRYFDGFSPGVDDPRWQIPADRPDYNGCLRAAFLEALGNQVPEGVVQFGKSLETYEDSQGEGKVVLRFTDGTVAEVDAVIGCDGISSRTRRVMLGEKDPAARPSFTHMVAYRAVVPIEGVVAAMGEDKGYSHCLHVGPGAYTVTYPIANNTLTNMILFCKTKEDWPEGKKLLESCYHATAQKAIEEWKPDVRAVMNLLPERPNKWAIFDMADHLLSSYACGRVCVAGDAAHASTPFLASGAAMGVEDAAVLATTLETALNRPAVGGKTAAITAAFQAFSTIRRERSQRVVTDSRAVGNICMWQNEEIGQDPEKCFAEIWAAYSRIWEFDVKDMVERARQECVSLLD